MQNHYTVGEAAVLLCVSKWTVVRWIDNGTLRARKVGKQYRIVKKDVDEIVEM